MQTTWPWPHRLRAIVLSLAIVGVIITAEQVSTPDEVVTAEVPVAEVLAVR